MASLSFRNCASHFGTDADNTVFVEVTQRFFGNVWNILGYYLRTKLGFTNFSHVVDDVNTSKSVVFNQATAENDGVFKVVPIPWHEGHGKVLSKC